jgi:hypothetical protein
MTSDQSYLALIGHVQSGKTHEEINFCYNSVKSQELPVFFLVRNITADQAQLHNRFIEFNKEMKSKVAILSHINTTKALSILNEPGIIITLCNHHQLSKIKELLQIYKGEYNLCIDEVDFSIKTKDDTARIDEYLTLIKQGANRILGATATPFALFSSEPNLSSVKKISPQKNYRGIDTLDVKFINPVISKNIGVRADHFAIHRIYSTLLKKDRAVILHSVSKEKIMHQQIQEYISDYYKFTVLTYNGDGIRVICKDRSLEPFTKRRSVNNYGQVINKYNVLEGGIHLFENFAINEVLQLLEDDTEYTHTHICIISGHLASRGISFVSSSYNMHLTDQYFHPGEATHGENLMQSLRILGCYVDDTPLTLWCSKETWKSILEQNDLINDLVNSCENTKDWLVKIQEINIKKPSRPATRPKLMGGVHYNPKEDDYNLEIEYQKVEIISEEESLSD